MDWVKSNPRKREAPKISLPPYQRKHFLSHRGREATFRSARKVTTQSNIVESKAREELFSGRAASARVTPTRSNPYEIKYRPWQMARKMTLRPKGGLIKALVWFCGIGSVEKGSQKVHDDWRQFC
jgi:hypothetical protein